MHNAILVIGGVYHIFSKSIAGFEIFNNNSEFLRIQEIIRYYQIEKPEVRFSQHISNITKKDDRNTSNSISNKKRLINVIAYCVMPTHLHLVLKQLGEKGISIFMNKVLNSYTRYFNIKHKRKGPLWETRFKRVLVTTDEQLLHLTRYIHLNPVTANLVNKPQEWLFSSYNEYLSQAFDKERICNYDDILDINPEAYRKFIEGNIDYQRKLADIKALLLEQNSTA